MLSRKKRRWNSVIVCDDDTRNDGDVGEAVPRIVGLCTVT